MTAPGPRRSATRSTGLGNHRAFQEEIERQWSIATRHGRRCRSRSWTSTTSSGSTTRAATPPATRSCARPRRPSPTYLRRSRPRVPRRRRRVRPRHARHGRRARPSAVVRRLLAACLDGEAGRDAARPSRSRRASARSRAAPATATRSTARPTPRCYWGKRHGRTCVTVYDAERHDGADRRATAGRAVGRSSPGSPRRAPCGRSSSRSTT